MDYLLNVIAAAIMTVIYYGVLNLIINGLPSKQRYTKSLFLKS